jgi:hypothetical protein
MPASAARLVDVGRAHEPDERYYGQLGVDAWTDELRQRMDAGDDGAVDDALEFLERDPYFFRSGYARERVARMLAKVPLSSGQRRRAREVVVSTIDGHRHCPLPGLGKLAGAVADNELRRQVRARLHSADPAVARRALSVVVSVRRPGLSPAHLDAARAITLVHAGRGTWLSPTAARHATYLWTPEWADELRSISRDHGPDRAAARRLLGLARQRRERRDAREAGGRPGP